MVTSLYLTFYIFSLVILAFFYWKTNAIFSSKNLMLGLVSFLVFGFLMTFIFDFINKMLKKNGIEIDLGHASIKTLLIYVIYLILLIIIFLRKLYLWSHSMHTPKPNSNEPR